jgi:tRNA threonylcarbamoyladenosine biosynthesis protein TsaE
MLPDPGATEAAGQALARALGHWQAAAAEPLVIYLEGSLGAGKTTLARALIRGLGHGGRVPSPTYTLVEPYELPWGRVLHLDLYRLADGAELQYLGLGDDLTGRTLLLVEWPRQGGDHLPPPDLELELSHAGPSPEGAGRRLRLAARTPAGAEVLARLGRSPPAGGTPSPGSGPQGS